MAFSFSPKVVTNGLVLALDAANSKSYVSGSTVWNDLTSFNSSGNLVNGPSYNSSSLGSIQFDGVDDYCLNVFSFSKTNVISINLWGNFLALGVSATNHPLFQIQNGLNTPNESVGGKIITGWVANTSGEVWGRIVDTANKNLSSTPGTAPVTVNQWNYYSYVADGSNYSLYINGIYKKQVAYSGTIAAYDRMFLAAQGTERSNIRIPSVQIYNRALSAVEILQNYNATKGRFNLT